MTDSDRISEHDLFSALGISARTSASTRNDDGGASVAAFVPNDDTIKLGTSVTSPSRRVRNSKEREEQLRQKSIRSRQWREELERKQAKAHQMTDETDADVVDDDDQSNKDVVSAGGVQAQTNVTVPLPGADAVARARMQNRTRGNTRTVAYNSHVGAKQNVRSNLNTPTSSSHSQAERKPFNNPWLVKQQTQMPQGQQSGYPVTPAHTSHGVQNAYSNADIYTARTQTLSSNAQHNSSHSSQQGQKTIPLDERTSVDVFREHMMRNMQNSSTHMVGSEISVHPQEFDDARSQTEKGSIDLEATQSSHSSRSIDLAKPIDCSNDMVQSRQDNIDGVTGKNVGQLGTSSSKKSKLSESKKESPLGVVLIAVAILCVLIAVSLLTGLWDISNL